MTGTATYIDDIPEIKGTLHAAPILSNVAHGRLRRPCALSENKQPMHRAVSLAYLRLVT